MSESAERLQEERPGERFRPSQSVAVPEGGIPLYPPPAAPEPYPIEALGRVLAPAARAIARKVQVPESMAGQSVLAVAALAAQALADVRMPFGQIRPLSLFLVTAAGSGDRKSSADHEAMRPVAKREGALKEQHETASKQWQIDHSAWVGERKKIEADKSLDLAARKLELANLGPEPRKPPYPSLTAPDPTHEGLLKAWPNSLPALGIFSSEGGQFFSGTGMSQENRLRTAAGFSERWDGRPAKRLRAGDGFTLLYGRRLSMHLLAQGEATATFMSDPVLLDQGLLSRILAAAPESLAGARPYREPRPEDDAAIQAYSDQILSILEAPLPLVEGAEGQELSPPALIIDASATAIWREFYNAVEGQCGANGELAAIRDFANKAAENAARLAGVLTVVRDPRALRIEAAEMVGAVTLVDWYICEALRLRQAARVRPELAQAQRLLDWLHGRGVKEIDVRDILRLGPNSLRTKPELDPVLKILIDHGWLIEMSPRPRKLALTAHHTPQPANGGWL